MVKYIVLWKTQEEYESEEFSDYYDMLYLVHELRDSGIKYRMKKVVVTDTYALV